MKKPVRILSAVLLGISTLLAAPLANAHDRDNWHRDRDDDRRDYRQEYRHDRGHHYGHRDRIYERDVVIRETRIIRKPVYVREPVYYRETPIYRRNPAIVIDVELPPLVFPLR